MADPETQGTTQDPSQPETPGSTQHDSEPEKTRRTKEQLAEVSRRNGAKSKGPVTAAGKLKSSRNALKTACTAKVHTLVTDDPATVQARHDLWHLYYQPASPLAFHHLREAERASDRLEQVDVACTSIVNTQIINASSDWRSERQKEIKGLSTELPIDPAQVVGFFRETAMGCDWLISRWERLGSQAEKNG